MPIFQAAENIPRSLEDFSDVLTKTLTKKE